VLADLPVLPGGLVPAPSEDRDLVSKAVPRGYDTRRGAHLEESVGVETSIETTRSGVLGGLSVFGCLYIWDRVSVPPARGA